MPFDTLVLFAVALLLVAVYPGALVLALIARVLESGWRSVLPFLAAMWLGEAVWLSAAVLGLAAIAANFETLFTLVKYAGIAYLAWLAIGMWRRPLPGANASANLPEATSSRKMFFAGLALSLGSPEIMVFYLALLPSLIDMANVSTVGLGELLLVMLMVLAAVDLSWIFFANRLRQFMRSRRLMRLSNRACALMMGAAAALLAFRQ